jgi:hypothetical protein
MRRLPMSEVRRRLLAALDAAPTGVLAEVVPEVYPELIVELEVALHELEARGVVVRHYRRWHVKRQS